jgi:hypothetical protein
MVVCISWFRGQGFFHLNYFLGLVTFTVYNLHIEDWKILAQKINLSKNINIDTSIEDLVETGLSVKTDRKSELLFETKKTFWIFELGENLCDISCFCLIVYACKTFLNNKFGQEKVGKKINVSLITCELKNLTKYILNKINS